MKKNLVISVLMTIVTTVLLGLVYPLVVTGIAKVILPRQSEGSLIERKGNVVGSSLIAQPFTGGAYFHPRESAAGNGYDAANSGGTNYAPTNQKLVDRVKQDVASLQAEDPGKPIPVDMVTTSASGLDPHISPGNAEFQIPRVAHERGISVDELRQIVARHTEETQLGFLGEPRVNVLELNLDLDASHPAAKRASR